jgi:hypothetical protein
MKRKCCHTLLGPWERKISDGFDNNLMAYDMGMGKSCAGGGGMCGCASGTDVTKGKELTRSPEIELAIVLY